LYFLDCILGCVGSQYATHIFTHTGMVCRVSRRWRFSMAMAAAKSPISFPGGKRDRVKSQTSLVDWMVDLLVIIQSNTVKMICPRVGAGEAGSV
jgi:hypothetical protein